ncbi:MAG: phosphotriesterase-related protein [SAR202 cluster bacterium]|nr:phosphotriesterase-related protein [SAR202 cluster bacterium]
MAKTPKSNMSGLAQSVLGPVKPETLGPTMTHEHLLIDFSFMLQMPSEASQKFKAMQPITMENLGWIRYNWLSNKDNLEVLDEKTAIQEARLYQMAGGGTIVDATTIGIGRDPLALARISRATGINVVMGAGFYIDKVHPGNMSERTDADLAAQMVKEITEGVGDTRVKAGIIGELGCSWPLTENERKVLRAAAKAQQATGAAILIHPGRDERAPLEIIEVLAEAGADIERTIMGHLDRTVFDTRKLLDLAKTGCYLEYDLFGNESSHYPLPGSYMPSDVQRMDMIRLLMDKGFGDKVLTAQDICTKHRLVKYGGHGYHHIIENIVPRMRKRGFGDAEVDAILSKNPASILAFK